jgi:FtsZ-interacting cell division protein ZipA
MERIFAAFREHPYLYGGIAVVVVLFVIYWYSAMGSSAANTTTTTSGVDPNADALAAADAQVQGQLQQTQIAADAQGEQDAASLQEYTLSQQTSQNANTLAAQVAELQASLGSYDTVTADTLQAGVDNNQISAGVQEQQIASNTTIASTGIVANALVAENGQNAQIASEAIQAASACHGVGCWF